MSGDVVAAIIGREYTRSRLFDAQPEPASRRRRRAAARRLQALAQRLDPQLAAPRTPGLQG